MRNSFDLLNDIFDWCVADEEIMRMLGVTDNTTGFDDGEEETVINLTVKPGMKQGWFGNDTGRCAAPWAPKTGGSFLRCPATTHRRGCRGAPAGGERREGAAIRRTIQRRPRFMVPKVWLLDYLVSDDYNRITRKSGTHYAMIAAVAPKPRKPRKKP